MVNKITLDYRIGMFDDLLESSDAGEIFKVKITGEHGETKWMDITRNELHGIIWVLTLQGDE